MKRRTKAEILLEFHRVADVFDVAWDIQCEIYPEFRATRHLVASREKMLGWVDDGKATASQILAGCRQALNDFFEMHDFDDPDRDPSGAVFLREYRLRTGREFFDDAGRPWILVSRVLARGHINDETEYQLLNAICASGDQKRFSQGDITKAELLLLKFTQAKGAL
jgi:hypothetical protein